jgi:hypothetical protein
LLKFHRELLFVQTAMVEKADQRQYSPYELLNLTLNDPRFNWLKKFSEQIVEIDIITDDKENKPFDAKQIHANVKNLISPEGPGATAEYTSALKSDLSLMISLNAVRKSLHALDVALNADIN